jgi:phytoene synthase
MITTETISPSDAMRYCRELTRRRARNFYYGLKLLPEPRRSALYAVYAWMRRADDITDAAPDDPEEAQRRIETFRAATIATFEGDGESDDPVLVAVRAVLREFPINVEHFHRMLDGQLDDLNGRTYESFEQLYDYCYSVASTVGLLCIEVWGYHDERAPSLAIDRGIAFQLTNILRDFKQDFDTGRVYLPADEFAALGLTPEALRRVADEPRCRQLLLEQVRRADSYYRRSRALDEMIDPACQPTLWAMTEIYHRLLLRIERDPIALISGPRLRLSSMEKGAIALRAKLRARTARKNGT